jgi:uncharacterized protein (TIGR00369 family)
MTGGSEETIDRERELTRLESVEEYLAHVRETTPYYDWLDPAIETVERGFVRLRQPYTERVEPPAVGPGDGMNGGVLLTLADAAAMAAIVADALEPVPLATTHVDLSFHDGVAEDHVVEADVVDAGETLATAAVEVVPASEVDTADRTVVASGQATARLFA